MCFFRRLFVLCVAFSSPHKNARPVVVKQQQQQQQQQGTNAGKRHSGSPGLKKRKPLRSSKTPCKSIKEAARDKTDAEAEAEKRFPRIRVEMKKQGQDLNIQGA